MRRGGRHYLTDALRSTVALADGSGAVQTAYTYEPFGQVSTSGASTSNPISFTNREADGTGLYFYRARYYDPRRQRFLGEDPLGFEAGAANLHGYALNDPVNLTDPTGEFAIPLALCAAGAGGSLLSDYLAGRKPNLAAAGGYCALGLGLGWAAPALGLGAGAAAGGAGVGIDGLIAGSAVTFGHGARHMVSLGLDPSRVESAIDQQIRSIISSGATVIGGFYGQVVVNGIRITYRAHPLANGTIYIGTYYGPK